MPDTSIEPYSSGRGKKRWVVIITILLVAVALCGALYVHITDDLHEQGAVAVRNSIMHSANQCFAIEGAYPASITYLENHYGLSINHKDYVITYEVFADNVAPTVVVIAR